MKVILLYSGGKDSNYALYWALNQGWDVVTLLNVKPEREDSFMFHVPCINLAGLQAKAAGIPLVEKIVSGVEETEVRELEEAVRGFKVDGFVSGAIASEYQRTRLEGISARLGLRSFTPLWHKNPVKLMESMIDAGFEIIFSGVSAYGLGREWVGRRIDGQCIRDLIELNKKYGVHVAGEGGEYETTVLDTPFFKKRIMLEETRIKWDGQSGHLVVEKAKLAGKERRL